MVGSSILTIPPISWLDQWYAKTVQRLVWKSDLEFSFKTLVRSLVLLDRPRSSWDEISEWFVECPCWTIDIKDPSKVLVVSVVLNVCPRKSLIWWFQKSVQYLIRPSHFTVPSNVLFPSSTAKLHRDLRWISDLQYLSANLTVSVILMVRRSFGRILGSNGRSNGCLESMIPKIHQWSLLD